MNDANKMPLVLFTPSGCLTGDSLMLFVLGSLQNADFIKAEQHIAECPLCADAADGLRLWLKENKAQPSVAAASTSENGSTTHSVDRAVPHLHKVKANGSAGNLLHAKTNVISDRIRQHLNKHATVEAQEEKRLSYKPFVWMSAAATIILFIGGFYVIWVQNLFDSKKLAQKTEQESVLEDRVPNADSTANTLLADKGERKPEKEQTRTKLMFVAPVVVEEAEDMEVFNQDDLAQESVTINPSIPYELPDTTTASALPAEIAGGVVSAPKAAVEKKSIGNSTRNASKSEVSEIEDKVVFTIVEEMPQFPGGETKRLSFLAENIKYPVLAAESGIQGTVFISFIVNADGKISNIKVLRGIGGGCDEEALNVVKQMPNWIPGRQNGKNVRVLYNMPVMFKLQK